MPTGTDLARAIIERMPDAADRALGRRLYKENSLQFKTEKSAYTAILRVRGKSEKSRRTKGVATHKRTKPFVQTCPPSIAPAWETFDVSGPCKVLVLSDLHVPYHDVRAIKSAVTYAKEEFNPNVLFLNGDFADFFSISRWEKDPKQRNLAQELGVVEDCLSWLKAEFPRARRIYKLGNHEERWDKYLWEKAPELLGVASVRFEEVLHLDKWGYEIVDNQRIVMLGELPAYHGHELPKGMASPVNAARGLYMRTAHSGIMGHLHRSSGHTEPDVFHSGTACWSTGCLCDLRPDYAKINKWNHGFAVVEVEKDDSYLVHNYRISKEGDVRNV